MVVTLVIGNHWRGQHIWGEVEDPARQKKKSEKTSAPIGAFSDEEFGKGSATASATSESKGYVIVKGKMDTHHRRSMTMNFEHCLHHSLSLSVDDAYPSVL